MTELYLVLSLLSLVACLFVAVPLMKMRRYQQTQVETGLSAEQQSIYQDKQQELEADLASQKINQEEFERATAELKVELASALQQSVTQQGQLKSYKWFALVPVVLVAASAGFYIWQGKVDQVSQWLDVVDRTSELGTKIVMGNGSDITEQDLKDFYLALRTKLVETPEDATGWLLLGRVSSALGDYEAAIGAFDRSLKFEPNKASTMMSYAQALLATHDENNIAKAKWLLKGVYQLEPNNLDALLMLGYIEMQMGDPKMGIALLDEAYRKLPKADTRRQAVEELLQQQGQMAHGGESELAEIQEATSSQSTEILPQVKVDVAGLQAQAKGFSYAFVFARPGKAGPPFAVKKIALEQAGLPAHVILTDNDAMMANMNLSALTQVQVTVRLSNDENVALGSDEKEWHSNLLNFNKEEVLVVTF
ncbi:c-type cytochrome biogenesis protein CcmI [Catenovulum sp. SM1970]|uniref:c-type cytochrome biogenesis protein CcmI n=1 Tax=Marinifaba aquimaris TaxID=2741323 RepID=UPI0015717978|nr:c-type cytochrome biogenesis protein CcmI [Marinifaba aquimaris]NTS76359.1 c-type cytochrome biogenesis protein CcmI [Marinifaba aquimaris]